MEEKIYAVLLQTEWGKLGVDLDNPVDTEEEALEAAVRKVMESLEDSASIAQSYR